MFSFSHNPVSVRIDVGEPGSALYDLFGGGEFPTIGEDGVVELTLATQSFYWLHVGEVRYQPSAF